jgi:hypothetical protein
MNLFETLFHPDREEHPERAEVARAANLLQVGEFQLLQLAYKGWFDKEMAPRECDRLFGAYMLHNQVPHWARHYARQIIGLDAARMLNDRDPTYHRYDPNYEPHRSPEGMRGFCTASAVIILFLGGGIWLSHLTAENTSQILPPYISDKVINDAGKGP